MKEPTKEEKNLCEQVAEKYRKKIEYGDWYINFDKEVRLKEFFGDGYREEESIPLWTISDCLEFFEKKGWGLPDMSWKNEANKKAIFIRPKGKKKELKFEAHTLLGACLKAVLVIGV